MLNTQDLKEAEWAFNIFEKCMPEKYKGNLSTAVLVGKYSDRTPSDETIAKIGKLYEQWLTAKNGKENKFKDFLSYAKYYFNFI